VEISARSLDAGAKSPKSLFTDAAGYRFAPENIYFDEI
jgi:hypothetical protein